VSANAPPPRRSPPPSVAQCLCRGDRSVSEYQRSVHAFAAGWCRRSVAGKKKQGCTERRGVRDAGAERIIHFTCISMVRCLNQRRRDDVVKSVASPVFCDVRLTFCPSNVSLAQVDPQWMRPCRSPEEKLLAVGLTLIKH